MPKKERAIASPHTGVGMTRYLLYRAAWKRIADASSAGFYLEAITLLEGILADRMESRASYLTGTDVSYRTLGSLIDTLRKHEFVADFKAILEQIDKWREKRNRALHEMVKFATGERPSWEDKTGPLPSIVDEGRHVLRRFDAIDKRERRSHGARPAATEPAAFGNGDLDGPSIT